MTAYGDVILPILDAAVDQGAADVILFLREVGMELPANPRASVDGHLGESVRFHADRSGNRTLNIAFRHLRHIPRTADTSNSVPLSDMIREANRG